MGLELNSLNELKQQVLDLSELHDSAEQPMRKLSTGMRARFAFAFATSIPTSILFIDESLAVGDFVFSQKALARIAELQSQGCTLVLVTHDAELALRFTDKCLWLQNGKVARYGNTKNVIAKYLQSN